MLSDQINTSGIEKSDISLNLSNYIKQDYRGRSHGYGAKKSFVFGAIRTDFMEMVGEGESVFNAWQDTGYWQQAMRQAIQQINEKEKRSMYGSSFELDTRSLTPDTSDRGLEQDIQAFKPFRGISITVDKPQSTQEKIAGAKTEDDIVRIISQSNFDYIKTYIDDLRKLIDDDEEDDTMHLESLRSFVLFLLNNPKIRIPKINITPNSFIDARWDESDHTTTLIMEFLPVNQISLAVVKRKFDTTHERQYVSKRVSSEAIMEEIRSICHPWFVT